MVSRIFHAASPYYQTFLASIPISELKGHFRSQVLGSKGAPKDFLEAYFHALGLASGHLTQRTCFWVDKTLGYEYMFYRYTQWWPNARFIFVVRDPRDIYSSYKKRDLKNDRPVTSIESFAVTWGNSVRALDDCRQMVAPENYIYSTMKIWFTIHTKP